MYKTYTIKAYKFKELSKGSGSISYYLVDDNGEERVVKAKAKRGLFKKIKSVQAIYHRETPLVEALANAAVKDTIDIDFSTFNNEFPRVENGSYLNKTAKLVLDEFEDAQAISTQDSLKIDKFRLFQLFVIACLCLLGFVIVKGMIE